MGNSIRIQLTCMGKTIKIKMVNEKQYYSLKFSINNKLLKDLNTISLQTH